MIAPARTLVVDDHPEVREMVCIVLASSPRIFVVGQAEDGREALHLTDVLQPDVVVMDISLPDVSGLDVTRLIKRAFPHIRVVIMTAHSEEHYRREAEGAGAIGYVLKETVGKSLLPAVDAATHGKRYVSPAIDLDARPRHVSP